MNNEANFIQAVSEDLDNKESLGVYADYLEERGETRGSLLRLIADESETDEIEDKRLDQIMCLIDENRKDWEDTDTGLFALQLGYASLYPNMAFSRDCSTVSLDEHQLLKHGFDILKHSPVRHFKIRLNDDYSFPEWLTYIEHMQVQQEPEDAKSTKINEIFSEEKLREIGISKPVTFSFTAPNAPKPVVRQHLYTEAYTPYTIAQHPLLTIESTIDTLDTDTEHFIEVLRSFGYGRTLDIRKVQMNDNTLHISMCSRNEPVDNEGGYETRLTIQEFEGTAKDLQKLVQSIEERINTEIIVQDPLTYVLHEEEEEKGISGEDVVRKLESIRLNLSTPYSNASLDMPQYILLPKECFFSDLSIDPEADAHIMPHLIESLKMSDNIQTNHLSLRESNDGLVEEILSLGIKTEGIDMSELSVQSILKVVQQYRNLKSIKVYDIKEITDDQLKMFCQVLSQESLPKLKHLVLTGCKITCEEIIIIIQDHELDSLSLSEMGLLDDDIEELVQCEAFKNIQNIDISDNNEVSQEGRAMLAKMRGLEPDTENIEKKLQEKGITV